MRGSVMLCALFLGVTAGCAQQNIPTPLHSQRDAAGSSFSSGAGVSYKSLYSFTGQDGARPAANLIESKIGTSGALYGTTPLGGANGDGVVFRLSTSGRQRVLYNFAGKPDGDEPAGALVAVKGMLYGTTYAGGGGSGCKNHDGVDIGCGTVFDVSKSGTERVLYRFKGSTDGARPVAGLIAVDGVLYGTTSGGGNSGCKLEDDVGCGTVFEVSTSGKVVILYRFNGGADGSYPRGDLISLNGHLYGTTLAGGELCDGFARPGCGTVFEVSSSGKHRVLHAFTRGTDGARPSGGLIAENGALYGTTGSGGENDHGTIFEVSASGKERVLYRFEGNPDGERPLAGLTAFKGLLYGTTESGGENENGSLFEVSTSGRERVLYSFESSPDGRNPHAGLISSRNVLYGMTPYGGTSDFCRHGCGTVFKVAL